MYKNNSLWADYSIFFDNVHNKSGLEVYGRLSSSVVAQRIAHSPHSLKDRVRIPAAEIFFGNMNTI